jgi:osmotically-inducible protein OsmY
MQIPTVADAHNGIAVAAKEQLRQSSYSSLRDISCECDDGVLILRGQVPNFFQKHLAQESVRHLKGVAQVVNQIEVCEHFGDQRG